MKPRIGFMCFSCVLYLSQIDALGVLAPFDDDVPHSHQQHEKGVALDTRTSCANKAEIPIPKRRCQQRVSPLLILAGEGKTGTESLATAFAMLGLKVAHFRALVQCCEIVLTNPNVQNKTVLGLDTGIPGSEAAPVCISPARHSVTSCSSVAWVENFKPYQKLMWEIKNLAVEDYDEFDWCVFDDFDAVADVPIPFITPYLYRAYGEGTKVINSIRNASDWARERARWDVAEFVNDTSPLGWLFSQSIAAASKPTALTNAMSLYSRSRSAAAYAYLAERALIRCVVDPADYLEINLFAADDPPKLWQTLATFLGRSTEGLDTTRFPHDVPGSCHSKYVRAVYEMSPNSTLLSGSSLPLQPSIDDYSMFFYKSPAVDWVTNLKGCATSVSGGVESAVSIIDARWENIFLALAEQTIMRHAAGCSGPRINTLQCQSAVQGLWGRTKDTIATVERGNAWKANLMLALSASADPLVVQFGVVFDETLSATLEQL